MFRTLNMREIFEKGAEGVQKRAEGVFHPKKGQKGLRAEGVFGEWNHTLICHHCFIPNAYSPPNVALSKR